MPDTAHPTATTTRLPLASIDRDPAQPRKHFDDAALHELADSIRAHGIIQPIVVRPADDSDAPRLVEPADYLIVAGERRWRASHIAQLEDVPVIIRTDLDAEQVMVLQVLENLQREGLTLPETAQGVHVLVAQIGTTKTAAQLGKSEAWVSKHARIGDLDPRVQHLVDEGALTSADLAHDVHKLLRECERGESLGIAWLRDRISSVLRAASDGELRRAYVRDRLSHTAEDIARHERAEAIRNGGGGAEPESAPEPAPQPAPPGNAGGQTGLDLPPEPAPEPAPAPSAEQHLAPGPEMDAATESRHAARNQLAHDMTPIIAALTRRMLAGMGLNVAALYPEVNTDDDTELLDNYAPDVDPVCVRVDIPGVASQRPIPAAEDASLDITLTNLNHQQAERLTQWVEAGGLTGQPADRPADGAEALTRFMAHGMRARDGASTRACLLRAHYIAYCINRGVEPIYSESAFTDALRAAGYRMHRLKTGRVFLDCEPAQEAHRCA
ncbi:ParB/RepB/Spo0J family partition protein [Algiphilus sp.]|uniref:ParB/RepB/Spo0J family partition protein n=1 Tax=Algiphilus sp. TaxID=1872431 RepID=UPI0025BBF7FA|nr:ParB/RepB/Spo0J family partition protein [Algiphilus sp.]MCK5769501.1 ParB/RepB/Spo0J family partition protein [Algiphilus sp.]